MDSVQAGQLGELILRYPLSLTDRLNALAHNFLDILQSFRLLTYAALKHPA